MYEKKREREIEAMKRAENERRYVGSYRRNQEVTSKPVINPKSRVIAAETGQRPIYERFQKIVDNKKKRIEENEELKKQREEEEYESFLTEFKQHCRVVSEPRDPESYFKEMLSWKEKLEKEKEVKREQKKDKELENHTFKPTLNKKSVRMLKNQKRQPIQDREIRPKTEVSEFSFQPTINKKKVIF